MATNGTNGTNGVHEDNYPSTLPLDGHNFQGIGLGIAKVCFANDAAAVYSLDISQPGEPFAELAKKYPGKTFKYIETDVTSEKSVEAALDAIVGQAGRFDGLVANAGATKHQPALEFSMEQVEKLFRLKVFGAWICATIAARKFITTKTKGSIIFTASMTSYRPNRAAPTASYGATKAAVHNMTHTLAMEWSYISPGFVKTALTCYVETSPDWDTKMKSWAVPYVYLLSDTATYTTGIDIPIAGIVGAW
ncbi:hypothetical protein SCUCBS95973_007407 [Sporothrix curviconia]|uniref:Uncharacterized protein n=1 Tax=Sporothrix curviconia TaxID=1260050 RepID=A0ABP0CD56_9PEZI